MEICACPVMKKPYTNMTIDTSKLEPYRWDYHGDKCANDYRENPVNTYDGFKTKEEEAEYLNERLEDATTDLIF